MRNKKSKLEGEAEEKKLPSFDSGSSPYSANNRPAARARGLVFRRGYYRDSDGCPILDRFGQPLG